MKTTAKVLIILASILIAETGQTLTESEKNFKRGEVFYKQGNFTLAQTYLNRAVNLGISNYKAYLYLGSILTSYGKYEQAVEVFRKGLKFAGNKSWILHHNIGVALYKLGRYKQAMNEFYLALSSNPSYAEAHWLAGMCAYKLKDKNTTIYEWEKYLAEKPNGPESDSIRKALEILKRPDFKFPQEQKELAQIPTTNGTQAEPQKTPSSSTNLSDKPLPISKTTPVSKTNSKTSTPSTNTNLSSVPSLDDLLKDTSKKQNSKKKPDKRTPAAHKKEKLIDLDSLLEDLASEKVKPKVKGTAEDTELEDIER